MRGRSSPSAETEQCPQCERLRIVDGGDGFDTVALSYVGATHGINGDTSILHKGLPLVEGAGTFTNVERFSDIALTAFDDKMVIGDQFEPAVVRSWTATTS
jgi:hypothetical protein